MKTGFYVTGRHPDAGWVATLLGPYADENSAAVDIQRARDEASALYGPAAAWAYGIEPATASPGAELLPGSLQGSAIRQEAS
jgi:hypothetical protein